MNCAVPARAGASCFPLPSTHRAATSGSALRDAVHHRVTLMPLQEDVLAWRGGFQRSSLLILERFGVPRGQHGVAPAQRTLRPTWASPWGCFL